MKIKKPHIRSFNIKLLVTFLLVGLLPLIIFGVLSIRETRDNLKTEIFNKIVLLAEAQEHQLEMYLESTKGRTADFALDEFIKNSLTQILSGDDTENSIINLNNHLIKNKKPLDENIKGIFIMDLNGVIISSTDNSEIGKNESNESYFINGKESISFATELKRHVHFGIKDIFVVTAPIEDDNTREIIGVIANVFDIDDIRNVFSNQFNFSRSGIFEETFSELSGILKIYIVNEDNIAFINPFISEDENDFVINTYPVQQCSHAVEIVDIYINHNEEEVIGVSMCMDNGWKLLAEINTKDALAPIANIQFLLGITIGLFTFLIIFAAIIFANKISRPIKELYEGVGVANNDNVGDEVVQLGAAFDKMSVDLKTSQDSLQTYATELEQKVEKRTQELDEKITDLEEAKKAMLNIAEDVNIKNRELAEEKSKDEAILASIGDALMACDRDGKIMLFNVVAEELTGFTVSEVIGKHYSKYLKFISEVEKTTVEDFIEKSMSMGEKTNIEDNALLVSKNGTKIPIADSAAPIKNEEGNILGCVVVFRDVTREREIDKMERDFISTASHQLRTPITGIKWVIEHFLKKEKVSEKGREYLQDIYSSTEELSELVDVLLNVSRIEGGAVEVHVQPIELVDFLKRYLSETVPIVTKKNLIMAFDEHPGSLEILTDKGALRNIIQSLVSNALEYTPEGGKIEITLKKKDNETFTLIVKDTGIGIPANAQKTIFDKFTRADNAKLINTSGTGLGLYIAKKATDLLGGKIWFESAEYKGTAFFVELPIKSVSKSGGKKLA